MKFYRRLEIVTVKMTISKNMEQIKPVIRLLMEDHMKDTETKEIEKILMRKTTLM